jgi:EAL domain-containing protein (putative c-di-GMP-specific phosphodiesterase class I)
VADTLRSGGCFRSVKQSILDLRTEKTIGYEFLSRTDIGGFEMPSEFFGFSIENNILAMVDQRCLEIALEAAQGVSPASEKHVNLFPSTMAGLQNEQFSKLFPPISLGGSYCVEVSEQQILGDPSYLLRVVQEFKKRKISVAIDDVGFGRSCLESLIVLQPDVIKIDKRLVQNISRNKNQKEMLRRLLAIVESLHAKIIAEGIENREDLEMLKELGVPYGQGFLWGQPA